jgi:hypothetical protein
MMTFRAISPKPALSLVVSGCHVNFWISTILIPYETARQARCVDQLVMTLPCRGVAASSRPPGFHPGRRGGVAA